MIRGCLNSTEIPKPGPPGIPKSGIPKPGIPKPGIPKLGIPKAGKPHTGTLPDTVISKARDSEVRDSEDRDSESKDSEDRDSEVRDSEPGDSENTFRAPLIQIPLRLPLILGPFSESLKSMLVCVRAHCFAFACVCKKSGTEKVPKELSRQRFRRTFG